MTAPLERHQPHQQKFRRHLRTPRRERGPNPRQPIRGPFPTASPPPCRLPSTCFPIICLTAGGTALLTAPGFHTSKWRKKAVLPKQSTQTNTPCYPPKNGTGPKEPGPKENLRKALIAIQPKEPWKAEKTSACGPPRRRAVSKMSHGTLDGSGHLQENDRKESS